MYFWLDSVLYYMYTYIHNKYQCEFENCVWIKIAWRHNNKGNHIFKVAGVWFQQGGMCSQSVYYCDDQPLHLVTYDECDTATLGLLPVLCCWFFINYETSCDFSSIIQYNTVNITIFIHFFKTVLLIEKNLYYII